MRKYLLLFIALLVGFCAKSQEVVEQNPKEVVEQNQDGFEITKNKRIEGELRKYTSVYGSFIQYEDYVDIVKLKLDYGDAMVSLRVYNDVNTSKPIMCLIKIKRKYNVMLVGEFESTEILLYNDLLAVIDGISKLKEMDKNTWRKGDYLRTTFSGEDLDIGFWKKQYEKRWYITINGKEATFKRDFDVEAAFIQIKNKVDEVMIQ